MCICDNTQFVIPHIHDLFVCGCVISRQITHMNESYHTYEWVMSHIWMRPVTHMNASRHTYEWVMSHIWMGRVTHMNESCQTYECVMSRIWRSHVTHMKESCHTYECVVSHIWMSHVEHMKESCHTYECIMSRLKRRIESCHTQKWVTNDSVMCAILNIHVSFVCERVVWHELMSHKWLSHMCDTTPSFSIRVQMHHVTHIVALSHVTHIHESQTTQSYMCYTSFNTDSCVNASYHTYEWVPKNSVICVLLLMHASFVCECIMYRLNRKILKSQLCRHLLYYILQWANFWEILGEVCLLRIPDSSETFFSKSYMSLLYLHITYLYHISLYFYSNDVTQIMSLLRRICNMY